MKGRLTQVERRGDVFCVRLARGRLGESDIGDMIDEMQGSITNEGCRKLALSLGPRPPEFLYSVFLAKLIHLQRVMHENGGRFALVDAGPEVMEIFATCRLKGFFTFLPDFEAAVAEWSS